MKKVILVAILCGVAAVQAQEIPNGYRLVGVASDGSIKVYLNPATFARSYSIPEPTVQFIVFDEIIRYSTGSQFSHVAVNCAQRGIQLPLIPQGTGWSYGNPIGFSYGSVGYAVWEYVCQWSATGVAGPGVGAQQPTVPRL